MAASKSKASKRYLISIETVRDLIDYDPVTGIFVWKKDRRGARRGKVAGSIGNKGYRHIGLDGNSYVAQRLAWFYVHGRWPVAQIDHRNGVRSDNRIGNLREATNSQNQANKIRKAGLKGAHRRKNGKWRAQVRKDGRWHYIGVFNSPEEAHAAYMGAAKILHGVFASVG